MVPPEEPHLKPVLRRFPWTLSNEIESNGLKGGGGRRERGDPKGSVGGVPPGMVGGVQMLVECMG